MPHRRWISKALTFVEISRKRHRNQRLYGSFILNFSTHKELWWVEHERAGIVVKHFLD
jgi:hypothetical protein